MENVNHPGHYNLPGRKECIVEMIEKFGVEKVQAFCELNAYKYRYRHEMKGGQEDLEKAKWYDKYAATMKDANEYYSIADYYGLRIQEQQLIEEMAELTQAICKDKRSKGEGQAIGGTWKYSDIRKNLIEELADVKLVLSQVIYLLDCEDQVTDVMNEKIKRTMNRIGEDERRWQ